MIHVDPQSGLLALSARGLEHVPSLIEIGMSVRLSSFSEKRAMALNFPLEYLLADFDLRLLGDEDIRREDGLDSVVKGGLSKTVRAARSLLGFARIDSRSLPIEFLGESGRLMGLAVSSEISSVMWGP